MGRGLPALMQLWDEFEDLRESFQIVAFHDKTVSSLGELDRKLEPIVKKTWKGRQLPFPILLDPSGTTTESYGVQSLPTAILIDPEGNIVPNASELELRQILAAIRSGD